jgi:hypothetical protein
LSKFAISKPGRRDAGAVAWLLAQTLWVGGLWLLHFLLLPAIAKVGLASLLVEELSDTLRPLLVGLTAICTAVQMLVLIRAERLVSLWRDVRGQLLLVVVAMAGSYFAVREWLPGAELWLMFSYLVMAFCGLLLVLQPVPERLRRKL